MNAEDRRNAEGRRDAEDLNSLSGRVIGSAIEVHRTLGPGLLESIYEEALSWELRNTGLDIERQKSVPVFYKGNLLRERLRLDMVVEQRMILECKARETLAPSDKPQLLSYLRLTGLQLGLLINFHECVLKNGIHRIVNHFPEQSI